MFRVSPVFHRLGLLSLVFAGVASAPFALAAAEPGPFFEAEQPFFQTQLQVEPAPTADPAGANMVVRGILIPVEPGLALVFDQELLRLAGVWHVPEGDAPVTLKTMAQISYAVARRKATGDHPEPTGPLVVRSGMHPGVASGIDALFHDPRPPGRAGDHGRGPLPAEVGRFEGVELAGDVAVLHYRAGSTLVREWHDGASGDGAIQLTRHFALEPHDEPVLIALGAPATSEWTLVEPTAATAEVADGARVRLVTASPAVRFSEHQGELVASFAPSEATQRAAIVLQIGKTGGAEFVPAGLSRDIPAATTERRWPGTVTAPVELGAMSQNGLLLDRIAVPEENPWRRRLRPADLAFLTGDRAAVLTYDGDVWLVDGFSDPELASLRWSRFASGLHEPLAIAAPAGVLQVATKNGVVRLYDKTGDGEADWFENFNDHMLQSQTTRSFPLDMAVGPDGSTYVTQGGIVSGQGMVAGGTGTAHAGAILKISPDGRTSSVFARAAREPFLTVHPVTGVVTGTDQQGHFIPSSVCYLIREGDAFGFGEERPAKLTPPLVWIPHDQDSSSSSQAWLVGKGMGPWDGKLLHLSYGTGRLFLISPDFDAPVPQGAAINLGIETNLPLLHARMHPAGDALYLASFQIWGTRTGTSWALARLRPGPTPVITPIAARSVGNGVVLEYASPLDPESLRAENVNVRVWNYVRSAGYGSGRFAPDGNPGSPPWGVGKLVLSKDGRSVFIHLPDLPEVMQVEVLTRFRLADGTEAPGRTYFTIHQHHNVKLADAGFGAVDLSDSVPYIAPLPEQDPSVELGRLLAESLGCTACHGRAAGGALIGPSWWGMYGSERRFADGTVDVVDDTYLREKILDPQKRRLSLEPLEMPSYRGVVTDNQLESLVMYLKTLVPRNRSR